MSLWPRLKIFCFKKRTHGVFYVANELRVNFTINDVTEQAVATCPRLLGLLDYFSRMYVILWFFACKLLRERVAVVEGCASGIIYTLAHTYMHMNINMHTCKHIYHTHICIRANTWT